MKSRKARKCRNMCDGNDDCFHFDNKKNKNGKWVCKQSIYEKTKVGKKQQKSIYDNRKKKFGYFINRKRLKINIAFKIILVRINN